MESDRETFRVPSSPVYFQTRDSSEQHFTVVGLGNTVPGAFTPVLAKHTKHLSLVDVLAVGVDRMQRNFEPMRKQVEAWKGTRLFRQDKTGYALQLGILT